MENKSTYFNFVSHHIDLPDNFGYYLDTEQIAWCMSPLHDKDVYDVDFTDADGVIHKAGELNKPHYHFIVSVGKQLTVKALKENYPIIETLLKPDNGRIEHTRHIQSMISYLNHKGFDNKYQYPAEDITMGIYWHKPIEKDNLVVDELLQEVAIEIMQFCFTEYASVYFHFINSPKHLKVIRMCHQQIKNMCFGVRNSTILNKELGYKEYNKYD